MKKIIVISLLFFFIFINTVHAQLADSPWPTFHGDSQRSGLSKYDTSHIDGTIKWVYEVDASIQGSPSIGADGTIYVGIDDGYLYAFNPDDGTVKWKTKIGTPLRKEYGGDVSYTSILSSPAIVEDGTIYISSRDQYLFAINPDGTIKWKFAIDFTFDNWVAPAIAEDGTIYMTSSNPKPGVYAINPDGTGKWFFKAGTNMFNSVSIGKDGTVYAALPSTTQLNALYALNPSDGSVKWEVAADFFLESTPTVADDGTVYVGTFAKDVPEPAGLYAIKDGKIKWYFETEDSTESMVTPAIGPDGNIYFGSDDGKFYAVTPEGKEIWQYQTAGLIEASPAIGADGTIYIGASMVPEGNPSFYALNSDGTLKWNNFKNSNSIVSSAAIGADGTVYVGSYGGVFYAFGEAKDGQEVVEQDIPALKHEYGWNPEDEDADCFAPKSPEIEEKCDIFCNTNPKNCPGYWERKNKRYSDLSWDSQEPVARKGFFKLLFSWLSSFFK